MVGQYKPSKSKVVQTKGAAETKVPYKGFKGNQIVDGFEGIKIVDDIVTFPNNMIRMINMYTVAVTDLLINPVEDNNYYKVSLDTLKRNDDWTFRNMDVSSATNWNHVDVYYQEAR